MKTTIPDLEIEFISPDLVRLEQSLGCGEMAVIDLHRIHLRLLAESMGMSGTADQDRTITALEDALLSLRNQAARLASFLASVPLYPCDEETEDVTMAFQLVDDADRVLDRYGIAGPSAADTAPVPFCPTRPAWRSTVDHEETCNGHSLSSGSSISSNLELEL